jgi:hypothetical protein
VRHEPRKDRFGSKLVQADWVLSRASAFARAGLGREGVAMLDRGRRALKQADAGAGGLF